ncbi:unnamed protein product [Blepharisma stoltei]|uniref:Uncharacterized protein n=1 Tax=Blepharisma stoltei TaxID=1481888 RepID=A0AAU9J1I9_9CILI|nr:unnamed protein product [Blepharisma stoltei]
MDLPDDDISICDEPTVSQKTTSIDKYHSNLICSKGIFSEPQALNDEDINPWIPPIPITLDPSQQYESSNTWLKQYNSGPIKALDKLITDIKQRSLKGENPNKKQSNLGDFDEFFQRMNNDLERRNKAREKIIEITKNIKEKEIQKHQNTKKIPKAQKEETFNRLIRDAIGRQQTIEMRQKIKELLQEQESKELRANRLSKDQEEKLVDRLQQFWLRKWEKIEAKKKEKELIEDEEVAKFKEQFSNKKSDNEVFVRLTEKKIIPIEEKREKIYFSVNDAIASGKRLMNSGNKHIKKNSEFQEKNSSIVPRVKSPRNLQNTSSGWDTFSLSQSKFSNTSVSEKNFKSNKSLKTEPTKLNLKAGEKEISVKSPMFSTQTYFPPKKKVSFEPVLISKRGHIPSATETYKSLGGI